MAPMVQRGCVSVLAFSLALPFGAPAEETTGQPEKAYPPAHLFAKQHVPTHSKFVWTEPDGVIELEANRTLRLALVGQGQKRWVELRAGKAAVHEKFTLKDGAIHLEADESLCLGSEGGVMEPDALVVVQPCQQDESEGTSPAPHQSFVLQGVSGRIRARTAALCMGMKGLRVGAEIILGECDGVGSFVQRGGMIQVRQRPDLHFNVKGGARDGAIVLWRSEAATEESFEISELGQLRLKKKPGVCLNVQRGVAQGNQVIGWPCSKEAPTSNELFGYDSNRGVVFAQENQDLVFNVKGGVMAPGDTIVLWPAREEKARKGASGVQEL